MGNSETVQESVTLYFIDTSPVNNASNAFSIQLVKVPGRRKTKQVFLDHVIRATGYRRVILLKDAHETPQAAWDAWKRTHVEENKRLIELAEVAKQYLVAIEAITAEQLCTYEEVLVVANKKQV